MINWRLIWKALNGPSLYRKYKLVGHPPMIYSANFFERNGENIFFAFRLAYNICLYLSPILLFWLYRRGWFNQETSVRCALFVAVVYSTAWILRGIGRVTNHSYLEFIQMLESANRGGGTQAALERQLQQYDFEFSYWPTQYKWLNEVKGEKVRQRPTLVADTVERSSNSIRRKLVDFLGFLAVHTFGRRLLYPGSLGFMQLALKPMLDAGRAKLVEERGGLRHKLVSSSGNHVEVMFVDRRNDTKYSFGSTLIICCEGNAGFFEIGSMATPLEAGYSVLGWNHPGFGGSTGVAWPNEERTSVDVVMQFAISQLGFEEHQIVFYAWSIGGFPATWAAMLYPNIKGLILDATFDDLLPLALPRMPRRLGHIVEVAVRDYMDLPIGRQLRHFHGPVLLIRRSRDEVIVTDESSPAAARRSNRANYLLKDFLKSRYPHCINETLLSQWLDLSSEQRLNIHNVLGVDDEYWAQVVQSFVEEHGPSFPSELGRDLDETRRAQMTVFLASHHFADFDSTHCTPLPVTLFHIPVQPWDVLVD